MIMFVYMEQYIISIKENMLCQDFNGRLNYRKYILKWWGVKLWDLKNLCGVILWGQLKVKKSFGFTYNIDFNDDDEKRDNEVSDKKSRLEIKFT